MKKSNLESERVWIVGSVIVGFAFSFYLYSEGGATLWELLGLCFAFPFLLWFMSVIMRVRSGALEKGFLATAVKLIFIFASIGGLIALTLAAY